METILTNAKFLVVVAIALFGCRTSGGDEIAADEMMSANQGEYEKQLIKEYFREKYEPGTYAKFEGLILRDSLDEFGVIYFDELRLKLRVGKEAFKLIFTKNILNPNYLYIIKKKSLTICCFEELTYLQRKGTQRRFRFWVYEEGFANPSEYLLELTNKNATRNTGLTEFLGDAVVTHLSEPRIII